MRLQLENLPTRSDFVETVYSVLVDAITDGSLAPGERITQEEIAKQLDVSRSPVLQALRLLKKDGLIEDAPGRGVQVAEHNLAIFPYAATQVKKVLTGNGRAPKPQMQNAICRELGLLRPPEPADVADALAIALCHCYLGGRVEAA